jgi:hypothetical protein
MKLWLVETEEWGPIQLGVTTWLMKRGYERDFSYHMIGNAEKVFSDHADISDGKGFPPCMDIRVWDRKVYSVQCVDLLGLC